ncbi:UDP-N-acetylglucosamine 2-epimerase (non-hydrolyzing) [Methanoplanus sp. FWC-SCC4]|uniref:UDP-N-acetylglucosamine 2-epimerase (Non-hydrolyzing) n=1 Tax=Methanochimaera problematica TaxID=2609417 RepID=A0AA97FBX7_9EURY|nr:UDP-N-acetylglucosamine 2-epimerase (non-hydrolyzing) [Methanoplanus sp. FWC-SCC4]WOF15394.1 UDP-N-acetylglucosamine 2-epimerase (non-hydrolyzing) [Methanoplanus sp. FWC-SCC4]
MKIMTVLGTRPEIIRLSRVIPKLDLLCDHVLVHTGQNYDPNLNEIFFRDLNIRAPDYFLDTKGDSFGEAIGNILSKVENIILKEKPDRVLILGDTNSCLSAVIAKRLGIPVFHMEAGNRCYDDRVPEEVNRRIIDHTSDILMPYTERSRSNLLKEGLENNRIFVTGNPISEVIKYYHSKVEESSILRLLNIKEKEFILVTLHRAENVDSNSRLKSIIESFDNIQKKYSMPVIVSLHPRTEQKIEKFGLMPENNQIRMIKPFGFFDFIRLEENAFCVITDSGTVQEECCIFKTPNITIRDVTERPETMECGSNIISGIETASIELCMKMAVSDMNEWIPPSEYVKENVSDTVVKIVLGYHHQLLN